jgi:hypothetical protein
VVPVTRPCLLKPAVSKNFMVFAVAPRSAVVNSVDPARLHDEGDSFIHQNLQVCACEMYHKRLQ